MTSITAAAEQQAQLLLNAARRAERSGFMVVLHGMNREADDNRFLFHYLAGGFTRWVRDWNRANQRKYVIVNVWPRPQPGQGILDGKVSFTFRLSRAKRVRPIVAALGLMSTSQKHRRALATGAGFLQCYEGTQFFEYSGTGRGALEGALAVLSMENHRDILTGEY
jgi:hypothetical protein